VLGSGADREHAAGEDGLLRGGDDPVQSAGAERAARQALELGGHALLKCRTLRRGQGILASNAAIFVDGIERDYENAKAMAERDPEVRLH
jgi:hypothetical protein